MLRRKIYNDLVAWKQRSGGTTALLIDGARRVGKSFIAKEFAANEYKSHREQLAAICSRYNLSLEEAFTSFAEVVVQAGRLPYDMEVPNAVTQAAMAAAEKGEGLSGTFDSAPELMVALGYTRGNSRRYTLEELDNEEKDAEMNRCNSSVDFEA